MSEPEPDGPAERRPPGRKLPKGLPGALAVTALLGLYVWQIAGKGRFSFGKRFPL